MLTDVTDKLFLPQQFRWVYLIVSPNLSKGNKKEMGSTQMTSEELKAEEDSSIEDVAEQTTGEAVNAEDATISEDEKNLEATQSSEQTKKEQQSAHEINPDVYEWPCGKESFQYMEESEDVIYFAKK